MIMLCYPSGTGAANTAALAVGAVLSLAAMGPYPGVISSLVSTGERSASDALAWWDAGPHQLWGDMVHCTLIAVMAEEAISLHMTISRCL